MLHFNRIYTEKGKNLLSFKEFLLTQEIDDYVENFILVKSLPRQYPSFEINEVLDELGLKANNHFEIGYNCSTILNVLSIVDSMQSTITVVYICDTFEKYMSPELIDTKPNAKFWNNYSSAIVFKKEGEFTIDIKNLYSITDSKLHKYTYFNLSKGKYVLCFNDDYYREFSAKDLSNEMKTISESISQSGITMDKIDAVITINREANRTEKLRKEIKNKNIISSRQTIGHTGGSDIFFNINFFINKHLKDKGRVLVTANALGYTWSCMQMCLIRN